MGREEETEASGLLVFYSANPVFKKFFFFLKCFFFSPLVAKTRGSSVYAPWHNTGDSTKLQSLQTKQAPNFEGGPYDGKTWETAEDRTGEEA